MLWDRQAAQLAEAMREQLKSAHIFWPWSIRMTRVRLRNSDIKVHLSFLTDIQLGSFFPDNPMSVGVTVAPIRWRAAVYARAEAHAARVLLTECVALMLLGIRREAERAGHSSLVAQIDAQSDKPSITWEEQHAGEAA